MRPPYGFWSTATDHFVPGVGGQPHSADILRCEGVSRQTNYIRSRPLSIALTGLQCGFWHSRPDQERDLALSGGQARE